LTPYHGYFLLAPRLIAGAADLLPVLWAPWIYSLAALILSSISIAWFALPGFSHLVPGLRLRLLGCGLIALMPGVGTILLSLANTQWYLMLWCGLVSLQRWPARKSVWVLLTFYALGILTCPVTAILAPLWLARALLVRRDRAPALAAAGAHLAYVLIAVLLLSPGAGRGWTGDIPAMALTLVKLMTTRVILMGLAGPRLITAVFPRGDAAVLISGAAIVLVLLLPAWRARARARVLIQAVVFLYLILASLAMLVLLRTPDPPPDLYFTVGAARYFFFGTAMFYVLLLSVFARIQDLGWARRGAYVLALLPAFAVVHNLFYVQPMANTHWPRWARGLEYARKSHARFPADIPINPRPWVIPGSGALPPDTLALPLPLRPMSVQDLECEDDRCRCAGEGPALVFALDPPRYVYALRVRYRLRTAGTAAQVSWRADPQAEFQSDRGLQQLPATGDEQAAQTVWVLDRAGQFRLAFPTPPCDFRLAEIVVLLPPGQGR